MLVVYRAINERNEPTPCSVSANVKVATLVAFCSASLVLAGCHRDTDVHWKPGPEIVPDDSPTPGMDEIYLVSEIGAVVAFRIDTTLQYKSNFRIDYNQIPQRVQAMAKARQASVMTGPGVLYCITYASQVGGHNQKDVMVIGHDSRYWYYGMVELAPSAPMDDFEAVFRDHFWDYGRSLSLKQLRPIIVGSSQRRIETSYFGSVELPGPGRPLLMLGGPHG